ncbi:hypothetical protein AtDm6_3278 [Acetobacter tropicalis]|uniref:Uncharacterized protein n=1 Tax=Acetobacter tropicalis TaxID=104102 RepID=A0A095AVW7_9PROT|nr:hypothetical protein AtDm6_3278 [Acetobacter tropicalis]
MCQQELKAQTINYSPAGTWRQPAITHASDGHLAEGRIKKDNNALI